MSNIEERLRDAMAFRAQAVPDDGRPLPAPRRASGKGPLRIAAATLAVAATITGTVLLTAPSPAPQDPIIVAMSVSGIQPDTRPQVIVFLCKGGDVHPSCHSEKATDQERADIEAALRAMPEVESLLHESRQEALANFRRQYKDDPELVRLIAEDDLPESFRILPTEEAGYSAVARAASHLPGVSVTVDQACVRDSSALKDFLRLNDPCSFENDAVVHNGERPRASIGWSSLAPAARIGRTGEA